MIKLALKLAALSFLECMLVTACMYIGCRLIDDVAAIVRFQTLDPLYEIPLLVFLGAVVGFLTVLIAVYIVYILLEIADRVMYKVKARELLEAY
ncbi:MAG: hypothetical protein LM580_07400 [Thermofilum sp.]|nr:hypothetical protein [Thermofilum sp.]MCC6065379.1 hypothetical protein [Thermofilum sp.]